MTMKISGPLAFPVRAPSPLPGRGGRAAVALLAAALLAPDAARAAPPAGKAPQAIEGTAEVRGSLDKDLIRRVIRRHLGDVRSCYEQGLAQDPGLQGRVMVQFVIGAEGSVKEAKTQSSTLNSPKVEECIVRALKKWEFPKPQGGIVVVTYPFVLKTG